MLNTRRLCLPFSWRFSLFLFRNIYRQSGWLCTRWGEIAQSLYFKYLYKIHCKSGVLLWALYNKVSLKSPQQFVGFTVTLVKIFKVQALCNFTTPCAKPPRLTVCLWQISVSVIAKKVILILHRILPFFLKTPNKFFSAM